MRYYWDSIVDSPGGTRAFSIPRPHSLEIDNPLGAIQEASDAVIERQVPSDLILHILW